MTYLSLLQQDISQYHAWHLNEYSVTIPAKGKI